MSDTERETIRVALDDLRMAIMLHPEVWVLAALYEQLLPARDVPLAFRVTLQGVLETIAEALPRGHVGCLEIADTIGATLIEKLVIYRAALGKIRLSTLWLHFAAARDLNTLAEGGMPEARAPCLMHAVLALDQSPVDNPAPYLRQMIGHLVLPFAPREAIRFASIAIQGGQSHAMDDIRAAGAQLGLIPEGKWFEQSMAPLLEIERACDLQPSTTHKLVTAATAAGAVSRTVTPAGSTDMPPPAGDAQYFLFNKAGSPIHFPPVTVTSLPGGVISVDLTHLGRTQFYVFDRDGACMDDHSAGTQPFIADEVLDVPGALCVIGDRFMGAMNVCHFLLDHLTRVALFDRFSPGAKILIAEPYLIYERILQHAGLADRVVSPAARRFSIRAETLLVSSNMIDDFRHPGHFGAPWAMGFLRERFDVKTRRSGQTRRIFISRADSKARNILNWPDVAPVLAAHGFDIVTLATMTLEEQIAIFAQAACVAGVHGAGLTNVIFAPPGLRVLEILPQMVASPAYWRLCQGGGHHYTAMIAEDPEIPPPDYANWVHQAHFNDRDVIINPARLNSFLERLLAADDSKVELAPADF